MSTLEIITHSPEETEKLGERLAALLPRGTVVALYGDLATGKTCLTRGMTRFFTKEARVHSPTFTLVNEYGDDPVLYHLDLYRLGGEEDLLTVGYEDLIESDGICIIEWADRAASLLPSERLDIFLEHVEDDRRSLHFEAKGMPDTLLKSLQIS